MDTVSGYEYTTGTHLLITDEDAADFLQSQFTNELRPVEAGRCTYGLWLDVKGKVVADSYVLCEGDERFRLLSETAVTAVLSAKLENHIIADAVVIEAAPDLIGFALLGAGSAAVLSELSLAVPGADRFESSDGCVVFCGRRSSAECYEVLCLSAAKADQVRSVLSRLSVKILSAEQIAQERMQAGYPLVPIEIGPSDMPGEGGLEVDAVSFTKGCYLGQEVVARMHNVGRPQRTLFAVSGKNDCPVCPLAIYNRETKQVGELRTAIHCKNGWFGVALLKHRFVDVGDVLLVGDDELVVERIFREQKGS